MSPCDTVVWTAEEKLCPPHICLAEEAESCAGCGLGAFLTIKTPSWSHAAESLALNEQKGPPSGAQRLKKVSSSNSEYSELLRGLRAPARCVLGLAGALVSGTLVWTIMILLGSPDGVD